jgi:hypothetical protein
MVKLLLILLYAVFCGAMAIFTYQLESTGQADARYLLVALGTVPLWGIPLFRKVYFALSTKRGRR